MGKSREEFSVPSGPGVREREGWLRKRGALNKAEKRRFFVLFSNSTLAWWASEAASRDTTPPRGSVVLGGVVRVEYNRTSSAFAVQSPSRRYELRASTQAEAEAWMEALRHAQGARMRGPTLSALSNQWRLAVTDELAERKEAAEATFFSSDAPAEDSMVGHVTAPEGGVGTGPTPVSRRSVMKEAEAGHTPLLDEEAFEFFEVIGEGSFGCVKKARISGTHAAAVKILVPSTEGERGEMLQEVSLLAMCNHPNVVKLYGICWAKAGKELWVAMELCECGSLESVMSISERPLTEPQVAFVCREVLSGLVYMHEELQMMHRDIKSANIMLNG